MVRFQILSTLLNIDFRINSRAKHSYGPCYISEENTCSGLSARNNIHKKEGWGGVREGGGGGFKEYKRDAFGKAETIQPSLLIDWPLDLMNISKASLGPSLGQRQHFECIFRFLL